MCAITAAATAAIFSILQPIGLRRLSTAPAVVFILRPSSELFPNTESLPSLSVYAYLSTASLVRRSVELFFVIFSQRSEPSKSYSPTVVAAGNITIFIRICVYYYETTICHRAYSVYVGAKYNGFCTLVSRRDNRGKRPDQFANSSRICNYQKYLSSVFRPTCQRASPRRMSNLGQYADDVNPGIYLLRNNTLFVLLSNNYDRATP